VSFLPRPIRHEMFKGKSIESCQLKIQKFESEKMRQFNESASSLRHEKDLLCGGNGYIKVYHDPNRNFRIAQKVSNITDGHNSFLVEEAHMAKHIGRLGAKLREQRRMEKGYDTEVRFSAPYVYTTKDQFLMDYLPKGNLSLQDPHLDTYDFLKQASKIHKDLHDSGYINGDAKPKNFVLGYDDKIRLIDFDSVKKFEDFHPSDIHTLHYSDYSLRESENPNLRKIDIYSVGVSVLEYDLKKISMSLYTESIYDDSLKSPYEKTQDFRDTYLELTKQMRDPELRYLVQKMLKGEYNSFNEILFDFHQMKTVQDKKQLKIELSRLQNDSLIKDILTLLKRRNKALNHWPISSAQESVSTIHSQLAYTLKKAGIQESVVQKFSEGQSPQMIFVITEKALELQRKKNVPQMKSSKESFSINLEANRSDSHEISSVSDMHFPSNAITEKPSDARSTNLYNLSSQMIQPLDILDPSHSILLHHFSNMSSINTILEEGEDQSSKTLDFQGIPFEDLFQSNSAQAQIASKSFQKNSTSSSDFRNSLNHRQRRSQDRLSINHARETGENDRNLFGQSPRKKSKRRIVLTEIKTRHQFILHGLDLSELSSYDFFYFSK
jgi:hypothetical protein